MLTVLNKYENAIFMWGHNHTQGDPGYGQVKVKGDSMRTTSGGPLQEISFTYIAYGSMSDGALKNIYGMLAKLEEKDSNTKITFDYRDKQGAAMPTIGGSVVIAGTENGNTGAVYQRVSTPVDGKTYLVVAESGGTHHALTSDATGSASKYLAGLPVTVNGNYVTAGVSPEMLWEFESYYDGYRLINDSTKYLYRKGSTASDSVYIGTADQYNIESDQRRYGDWLYDGSANTLRTDSSGSGSATKYYLRGKTSGSNYEFYIDKNTGTEKLYLYELSDGPMPVDKTVLTSAIAAANTNKGSVTVSTDGKDIDPSEQWVTQAAMTAYTCYRQRPGCG